MNRRYDPEAVKRSPLLAAMKSLSDKDTPGSRRAVYEELLRSEVIMPVPQDKANSVYIGWGGNTVLFVDGDSKKRWCGDCGGIPMKAGELFEKVRAMRASAGPGIADARSATINPKGPGYLELNKKEMDALAAGNIELAISVR